MGRRPGKSAPNQILIERGALKKTHRNVAMATPMPRKFAAPSLR